MAPKIQHKRSSTQDNPPSAGDLAAGEIAINTNQNSANIHFEDSAGGVRSVGADPTAVGNYSRRVATVNGVGTWVAEGSEAPANGTYGHWTRNDTSDTLSPKTAGDDIVTTGDMQAGNFVLDQTTADVTVTASNPAAARTYTFPDAGGNRDITLDPATPGSTTKYVRQITDAGVGSWVEEGTAPGTGTFGYWTRSGTNLQPKTNGDALTNVGNITGQAALTIRSGGNDNITLQPGGTGQTNIGKYDAGSSQRVIFRSAATTSAYRFYNEDNTFWGGFRFPSTLTANRNYTWQNASGTVALVNAGTVDPRYVAVTGDSMSGTLTMANADIQLESGAGVTTLTIDGTTAGQIEVKNASGTTTIELDGSTGDVQMASQNGGQLAGFRNQIINGDFRIWQRGTSIPLANSSDPADTGAYTSDRWFGGARLDRVAIAYSGVGGFAQEANITPGTSLGSITQGIELSQNGHPSQFTPGSTWTLSFYSNRSTNNAAGAFCDSVNNFITGTATEIFSGTPALVPGETQRYSLTFTIPDPLTIDSTNLCFAVRISASTGDQIRLTGVQLEPGSVSTVFEHRPIETELALCKRYYQTSGIQPWTSTASNIPTEGMHTFIPASSADQYSLSFPVELAKLTSLSIKNTAHTANQARRTGGAVSNATVTVVGQNRSGFSFTTDKTENRTYALAWEANGEL